MINIITKDYIGQEKVMETHLKNHFLGTIVEKQSIYDMIPLYGTVFQ